MSDADVFPKVSAKPLPGGGFDAWCRGCYTAAYCFDESHVERFRQRHDKCPNIMPTRAEW